MIPTRKQVTARRRAKFQRANKTQGASGAKKIEGYSTYAERWARVNPIRGSEFFAGQQVRNDVTHVVYVRYDLTVAAARPEDRLVIGDRVLEIAAPVINMGEQNEQLEILCKEPV